MVSCMVSCLDMVMMVSYLVVNVVNIGCDLITLNNIYNFIICLMLYHGGHNFPLDKCRHLLSQVVLLEN
jgi:hypothetical protein